MPKFRCTCGEMISYGSIPSTDEWLMISDVEYDKFVGAVDSETVYMAMTHTLRCPICKRLNIFWDGFGSLPEVLIPDLKQG